MGSSVLQQDSDRDSSVVNPQTNHFQCCEGACLASGWQRKVTVCIRACMNSPCREPSSSTNRTEEKCLSVGVEQEMSVAKARAIVAFVRIFGLLVSKSATVGHAVEETATSTSLLALSNSSTAPFFRLSCHRATPPGRRHAAGAGAGASFCSCLFALDISAVRLTCNGGLREARRSTVPLYLPHSRLPYPPNGPPSSHGLQGFSPLSNHIRAREMSLHHSQKAGPASGQATGPARVKRPGTGEVSHPVSTGVTT